MPQTSRLKKSKVVKSFYSVNISANTPFVKNFYQINCQFTSGKEDKLITEIMETMEITEITGTMEITMENLRVLESANRVPPP